MNKHTTTLLILSLLALLLPSCCGTNFGAALYKTGTTTPYVMGSTESPDSYRIANSAFTTKPDNPPEGMYDLYQIGDAYYTKVTYEYLPVRYRRYTWNNTVQVEAFDNAGNLYDDSPAKEVHIPEPERVTLYCPYRAEDAVKCQELGIPVPQADKMYQRLTEEQANKQNPVLVKRFPSTECFICGTKLPASVRDDLPDHKSLLHYATLPVAGATFVLVDIPCTIVASILDPFMSLFGDNPLWF